MNHEPITDRRLVQVLEVGAEGIKICKNGFLMEESLKIKPVVCEGKNVPNLVDYDGRSLPNCLKGCLNDLDCQVEQGRCIKGIQRYLPIFVPLQYFSHHFQFRCLHGWMLHS